MKRRRKGRVRQRKGERRKRKRNEKGRERRAGRREKEREREALEHIIFNTSNTLRTINSYHFTKGKLWHSIVNFLRITLSFRIIYIVFIII